MFKKANVKRNTGKKNTWYLIPSALGANTEGNQCKKKEKGLGKKKKKSIQAEYAGDNAT